MINQAILDEIEVNRQIILGAPNDVMLSNSEVLSTIESGTKRILALAKLLFDDGEWEYGLKVCREIKQYAKQIVEFASGMTFREVNDFVLEHSEVKDSKYDLYWDIVLEETPYDFESFMFYMEKNRPFTKKFYEPRMYTKDGKPALKKVADELQNLEFRKYDFLGISQPSRTGKSTICIFFLCWKALRNPNAHNAMGGHAGTLVKGFYKELLNLMTSEEYTYSTIYTHYRPLDTLIRDKSAEDFTITLGDPDRFATITCRGIDATWTGAVDVSKDGILYVDDLVRDRQHSLSPIRMEETFQEYLNKMVDRKNDGAQELMVGTLWNVLDPLERLSKIYADNPRYKFLRLPALDENDESNFDYVVNGFSTEYYKTMRERLDPPEWQAKYMQNPFVREGLMFPSDQMKYFDGLICEDDIKRVYAVADSATGGGDNVSCPICYEMKDGRRLICKWIYDKRTIAYTVPRVVSAIIDNVVTELRVERNGVGALYLDKVKEHYKKVGAVGCKIIGVSAPNRMSKDDKIQGYSDSIKGNYEFLPPRANKPDEIPSGYVWFERDPDYQNAMDCMAMYTSEGKNFSDDAPDSMAQLAIMDEAKKNGQIEVIRMPSGFGL